MALKYRKKLLVAKVETTYGQDAAPTGLNAMMTHGLTISPMEGDTISRDLDRPSLGNDLQIHLGTHVAMEFDVEAAGAGAAGDVPAYGPLLRGCALAETVNAGVSVEYDPVSSNEESVTMYMHLDGNKHAMTGARGSVSTKLDPKGIVYLHFKFIGLWVDPETLADPTPDFSGFQVPKACTNVNTPTFALHGYSAPTASFSFDQSNSVYHDELIGSEVVAIEDRKPSGNVIIEAPALDVKNFFTLAKANTTGALQWIHGTTAGNIVQFDAPVVQILKPSYQDRKGKAMLSMGLSFIPTDAGDDEFKITVR